MGFWEASKALFSGRPNDAANLFFVDDANLVAGDNASRRIDELNQKQLDDRKISSEEFQRRRNALTDQLSPNSSLGGSSGAIFDHGNAPFDDGFVPGFKEGAANVAGTIKDTISGGLGIGLNLIPWQVWIVLGLALVLIVWPYFSKKSA